MFGISPSALCVVFVLSKTPRFNPLVTAVATPSESIKTVAVLNVVLIGEGAASVDKYILNGVLAADLAL